MSKKKKILLALLALVIVGCVGIYLSSGAILASGIEVGGTAAVGTETTLESASLSLFGGSVGLSGLAIANPEGFRTKRAVGVGDIAVDASVTSLLSDVVRIEHIIITEPELTLELGPGGTNLKKLLDNLGGDGSGGSDDESAEPGKKLKIDLVRIVDPTVIVSAGIGNLASATETVKLDTFELVDIGSGEDDGTVTLAGLMELVLASLGAQVAKTGKGLPPELASVLKTEVASETVGEVLSTVGKTAETVKDAAEKVTEDLKSGIEGILGGNKDD